MIPTWLDAWAWVMIVQAILLSIPRNQVVHKPDLFRDTMFFTFAVTVCSSMLQELYLQSEYRFCKCCRGKLPHWKKWGPFYCILISFFGLASEPVLYISESTWKH